VRSLYATAATAALTSLPALAAPRVEPVPEYAPVQAVLLSEDLFSAGYHAPELLAAITAAKAEPWIVTAASRKTSELEAQLLEAGAKPEQLKAAAFFSIPHGNLWLRDYGPVMVREGDAPGSLAFVDLKYDGAASVNDDFPRALGKRLAVPTSYVPALVDGGNLLTAGDFCFTSAEKKASLEDGPVAFAKRHGAALGCKTVLVVENPPHEHVDMWAKVVARDTVLVNELSADSLKLVEAQYGHIPPDVEELKSRLDGGARQLEKAGMKVERIPMPLPYRGGFRTFANAVLVNGTAIVPSFKRFGWGYDDYPDAKLESSYEEAAKRAYERHGFRTSFVNADGLIFNGGGFHCVLLQIPALKGVTKGH
jgi:agmatine/peptidylarginine deiminase